MYMHEYISQNDECIYTSNMFLTFLEAVKTLQLNVLPIVKHCRRQGGGGGVLTPQYISTSLYIICIHGINNRSYRRLLMYL